MVSEASVVCAFDKFRGTATGPELVDAAAISVERSGRHPVRLPLSDGGEGSIEVVGGANKRTVVSDPLGRPVEAAWRLEGDVAFIEMAAASGLELVGGAAGNDPLEASTRGTGELVAKAVELGARTVYVLLGGSATTDGGWGAIQAMPPKARLLEVDLVAGCDVRTRFCQAAEVFGPQKGASDAEVRLLTRRLERLSQVYEDDYGVGVSEYPGTGAAGGLAGGLFAVGARLESGFEVLAEAVRLDEYLPSAELVITGEGFLDAESFNGKVVGGVADWARHWDVPVLAVVGDVEDGLVVPPNVTVVSLARVYGSEASYNNTLGLVGDAVSRFLVADGAGKQRDNA